MSKLKLKNVPLSTEEENENLLGGDFELLNSSGIFNGSGDIFIGGGSHLFDLHGNKITVFVDVEWDSGTVHIPAPDETDEGGNPITVNNNLSLSIRNISYTLDSGYDLIPYSIAYPINCSGVWVGANTISVTAAPSYINRYSHRVFNELLTGTEFVPYTIIHSE